MNITKDQVEHIAWLARIKLTEEEKENYTKLFNDILDYFRKIDEVDTSNIDYTFHGVDIKNVFRDDTIRPSLPKEDIFKNVPKRKDNFVKAPRMV
ncbi:MAG: Asp-tRNA(Asn)/Glu-tRNA(Gln) amidotransferase subunit GatC [Candidatus Helarchaeota archaeon]